MAATPHPPTQTPPATKSAKTNAKSHVQGYSHVNILVTETRYELFMPLTLDPTE